MKLDVLSGLKKVKICTKYKLNNKEIDYFPANIYDVEKCKPIYKEFEGWSEFKNIKTFTDFPKEAQKYINFIADKLNVKISLISFGPERNSTIVL
jgi:adenylosuccinate synthase